MVATVLCVCTGNICRSPLAADVLRAAAPQIDITSAGLHALVGHGMDPDTAAAAQALGLTVTGHLARQFTDSMGSDTDLILVMDRRQLDEIRARWPHLSGKTLLLGQFDGRREIPDPYRMGYAMHLRAAELIAESAEHWTRQLRAMT
ncbi:MAG: low molecular weight protein-tyrosine-phosphatase [Roseovarius sp.]|jgi:protein-tyrosine phosphatase|nr:low molecular weight protein-tyrosine-phosphatase [Roseovarius sp.]